MKATESADVDSSTVPCESCHQEFRIVQMHGVCVPGLDVRWLCPPCNDMFWRVVHHFNRPKASVE